jgi:peroxiredoxin
MAESMKLPFPVLSDPDLAVTKLYAGVHPKAGPGGSDQARPTTVIVGKDGAVKWVNQYDEVRSRPDPAELAAVLRK